MMINLKGKEWIPVMKYDSVEMVYNTEIWREVEKVEVIDFLFCDSVKIFEDNNWEKYK